MADTVGIEQLADLADKIVEVSPPSTASAAGIAVPAPHSPLQTQLPQAHPDILDEKSQSGKKGSGKPVKGGGFNESLKSCEGNPIRQPTIDSSETEVRLTFRSEYKRLLTYHSWPRNHLMEPRDLAKAGFYFLEKDDIVQCFACFACFGTIWDLEPRDNPRHFPSCPFVEGLDVNNEPITDLQIANVGSIAYREPSGYENTLQVQQFSKQLEADLPQTAEDKVTSQWEQVASPNRILNRPKYPDYVGENARVATYDKGWPGMLGITPQQLAQAGFFYTAVRQAKEMREAGTWKEDIEAEDRGKTQNSVNATGGHEGAVHPSKQIKGKKKKGTNKAQMMPSAAVKAASSSLPAPTASVSQEPPTDEAGVIHKKFSMDDQLDMAMNSRLTKRIVKEGYDADLVKQVVQRQLRRAGEEFKKFRVFLAAVRQANEMREAGTWEEDIEEGEGEESRGGANRGAKEGMQKITAEVPEKRDRRKTQNSVNATGGSSFPQANQRKDGKGNKQDAVADTDSKA